MKSISVRISWLSFITVIVLSSCISVGRISVQVPVPPEYPIANDIQSIVIMNRSMSPLFSNFNSDSLEALFIRKKLSLDQEFPDSTAADSTIRVVARSMFESGRFDMVIPVRRNLPNINISGEDKSMPLNFKEVKQICTEFNVDALLVLESFREKVKTGYQSGYAYGNTYSPNEIQKEYTANIQVAYHSFWRLYQPKEKLLTTVFQVNDTIYWERASKTLQDVYEQLPTIQDALMGGALDNGINLAQNLCPGWKEEERKFYITGNAEADKAISLLKENKIDEAKQVWNRYSATNSLVLRSQIEFNLALAAEMAGDIDQAISLAEKSFRTKYNKITEDYIRTLLNQKNTSEKLK